ncbi:putative non-specific serine/threonine protein kinase [Helianthus annuus]|uniref:Non-specific serine/threonine protein kinase n=1 Tax=Helianthus annuus TaxID=4232 RepID=A0A251VIM5_HELAN|nr:putative non-specific serine/threonine protein kinase [Helianthus annuus]KAJ0620098.1 putative non-specific serine/threonine protein kinase [Helianthus annuus]
MISKIYHKHFTHPIFFFITLVFLLESFTTTTALFGSLTQPPTSLGHRTGKCTKQERQALLHFKSYIHYDPYGFLDTWTPEEKEKAATSDCCYWSGVTCNKHSRVTSLDLYSGNLEGKLSPLLLNLSHLNYLDISSNSFNGTIPMFIGSMTQLRYLNLGWNHFSGTIPSELGNLTNLQELSLDFLSSCTVENLDWLSHLSHLDKLFMSGTSLGKVDHWVNVILSLKKLSALYLNGCDLSLVVHPYVNSSFSSSIVTLSLQENNLNSSMYHWLLPLTSNALVELDLSRNMLDGIPKYLGNLCGLTSLYFYSNLMPVKLPDFLRNLSGCTSVTLQHLDATSSQFTGSVSDDIQNFSSLQDLYLYNNQLDGTISEKVWQLPKLQTLYASSNLLKGVISENIEKSNILYVYLSNNSLEGVPLEANMSNISNIEDIDLSSCKLGPRFPKWIQTMKNLSRINLAKTRISDNIPEDFWKSWPARLRYLNISFNNITGIVTDMLSNFDPVVSSTIDLSSNNFYGHILNVPFSLEVLDLSKNNLSGQIFFLCQIFDGPLTFLDLSHNSFTGLIPDCLWHFTELKVLSLGYNNLSGRLPTSIKFLINLEVLYLYNNSFSGNVTPRFPRVSPVGPVGDYRDVVGNNIVKPQYINAQRKHKDKYNSTIYCNIQMYHK